MKPVLAVTLLHQVDIRGQILYRSVSRSLPSSWRFPVELTATINDPKAYTKPWLGRDKLALRLMPPDTDLMEMIPSATEALEYQRLIANPAKPVK